MKHTLNSSLFVPLAPERVFGFFADPDNLARITPPELRFRMVTPPPVVLGEGAVIDYRFRVFGFAVRWRSLIEDWHPPLKFRDVQLAGPYKHWTHVHRCVAQAGGTNIEDTVEYELPLQPVGELLHGLVRRQLDRIFAFRREATGRLLQQAAD